MYRKMKERHSILIYENKHAVAGAFFEIKINEKKRRTMNKEQCWKKKIITHRQTVKEVKKSALNSLKKIDSAYYIIAWYEDVY